VRACWRVAAASSAALFRSSGVLRVHLLWNSCSRSERAAENKRRRMSPCSALVEKTKDGSYNKNAKALQHWVEDVASGAKALQVWSVGRCAPEASRDVES
jgi:hypothetical protein